TCSRVETPSTSSGTRPRTPSSTFAALKRSSTSRPMMRLDGKVGIVTGAESETGRAIVTALTAAGASVAACTEREPFRLEGAAPPDAGPVLAVRGIPSRDEDAQGIVRETLECFGRLDVLVNYGAMRRIVGTIAELSDEDFDEELAADVKGVICLSRHAVPALAGAGGGSIVNISSIAGWGVKGRALSRAMALDHASQSIRVNAILVGPTLTADLQRRPEMVRTLEEEAPLGRLHTSQDIADLIVFLASDHARNLTGALLPLDAGRSLPHY